MKRSIGAFALLALGLALVVGGGSLYSENANENVPGTSGMTAFIGISLLAIGILPGVIGLMMLNRK